MNSRVRLAKCLIVSLLQEKTPKEKKVFIRVLEYVAINASRLRSKTFDQKDAVQAIEELGELVSTILDGVML
jgi:hypothetical protein